MKKYRVVIDHSTCSGTSNCAEAAPEAYEVNDRGLAVVRSGCPDEEAYLEGAKACPVDAISVYDAATGTKVYP